MMDLEVVGRHALLFDDDATAAFVNSGDALVDWNSLLIDRYDVRHLLSAPPPPRKLRRQSPTAADAELDNERFLDLPQSTDEEESNVVKSVEAGGYNSVAFSYGNVNDSTEQMNFGDGMEDAGFRPPFPVPESLLHCLPPTEKVHQIIARTALYVAKHGGQSEIVLRVRQGHNPTFGFLMPDHHLHAYFRFLIDHHELLKSEMDGKSEIEKDNDGITSGALYLLGSIYGSGEDEESGGKEGQEPKEIESVKTVDVRGDPSIGHGAQATRVLAEANGKDAAPPKNSDSYKEKVHLLSRNSFAKVSRAGIVNGKKKEDHSISVTSGDVDKPSSSATTDASKVEPVILEPPSDLKRSVNMVVEYILKSGMHSEALLAEQVKEYGKFPFLLPSNQFHPYYVNALRKAHESKLAGKSMLSENNGSKVPRPVKRSSFAKENDHLPSESASNDIPYDYRKEKFKMVLSKSKKDGEDQPSGASQSPFAVTIDAAQTAAILQAATRGIKNPSLGILPNTSYNGGIQMSERKDQSAMLAANEAVSNDAHMTKEQKLKAERLKRAKLFVSALKSGAAPAKLETSRGLSVDPQESRFFAKEREGSLVPSDVVSSEKKDESDKKHSDDELHERMSKRKYRSRSTMYIVDKDEEKSEDDKEKGKDDKRSRRKHRSGRSSRENGKNKEEDEEYRDYTYDKRKHRSHRSSRVNNEEDDEERDQRHGRRKRSRHSCKDDVAGDDDRRDRKKDCKKHRSHHSSQEDDDEDEYEGEVHGKHSKKKRRSHHSPDKDDEAEDNDKWDHNKARKKHRSHHSSEEDDDDDEDEYDEESHGKHSRKKHRSHHSSDKHDDAEYDNRRECNKARNKHRSYDSSEEDDDEDEYVKEKHDKHSKKKQRSRRSSRHSRGRHKHKELYSSSRHSESREGRKDEKFSDDEDHSKSSPEKCRKVSRSEEELEEGEISAKISERSRVSVGREASVDISSSYRDGRATSQPLETTEVSDDLRAKIRAMLMANY